jgi:hypothetical protein
VSASLSSSADDVVDNNRYICHRNLTYPLPVFIDCTGAADHIAGGGGGDVTVCITLPSTVADVIFNHQHVHPSSPSSSSTSTSSSLTSASATTSSSTAMDTANTLVMTTIVTRDMTVMNLMKVINLTCLMVAW